MIFNKIALWMSVGMIIVALMISGGKVMFAQNEGSSDAALTAKLDQILGNQKTIMADLAQMKEQLRILTIRVTQAQ